MPRLPAPIRSAKAEIRPAFRRATAAGRSLPDFVIIGTQKAATTSLMHYLREHPDVLAEPGVGEVHFFDKDWNRGERFYRSFFPLRRHLERHRARTGRTALTGEKTPYYMFHPLVPERMHATIPDVRLIAILRDPVTRASSHHRMNFATGIETLGLGDAIDAEPERIAERLNGMLDGTWLGQGGPAQFFSYVARGRYAEQLDRWLPYFRREQLLVIRSEDLAGDPQSTYDRVLAHLALAPHRPEFVAYNASRRPYQLDPEVRARLETLFVEPNRRLMEEFGIGW